MRQKLSCYGGHIVGICLLFYIAKAKAFTCDDHSVKGTLTCESRECCTPQQTNVIKAAITGTNNLCQWGAFYDIKDKLPGQKCVTLTLICQVELSYCYTEECARGTYGSGCTYTCGQCLNGNETCSTTDGRCSMGCREGWQGETFKTKSSQTLSREDMTVIGGSVAGVCVGALIINIIIIAILKQRRSIDTGDPEMEMNETGVSREQTFGDSADKRIMSPSYYNVASLCIPTTTASINDSEHAVAQITEAEYEKLQDRGRIESSIYCRINGTETENTIYDNEDGLNIKQA